MKAKGFIANFLSSAKPDTREETPVVPEGHCGACLTGAGPMPDCPFAADDECPMGRDPGETAVYHQL
ncbi:hypothetical protein [Oricola sp.]|uniref:hypothetical protein n=1 Tax=Oricola sp. TaxID=1979950 RepID=UPI003BAAE64B